MSLFAMALFILFLTQTAWSIGPAYSKTSVCTQAFEKFQNRFSNLEKKYQTISDQVVSEENKPTWAWGRKKKAVYLLHGFIGTPEEMSALAIRLRKQNYTVINDLIPGYGSDGFVANQFNSKTWINHVEANLNAIRNCFDEIHLVGFSTGGLLLHNYIRQHQNDFTAKSLTLYSPFYKPRLAFTDFLRAALSLLTPVVSTKKLYNLTHFPDIKVAVLKPENYLQQLPLNAAEFVVDLGENVDEKISKDPLKHQTTPTLLFISETDQILSLNATLKNVSADFLDLTIVRFNTNYVPHHLMVHEVSSVAEKVIQQSIDFILSL